MNIFRLAGDMTHLLSVVVLLLKIHATRSCRGKLHACRPDGGLAAAGQDMSPCAGISLKTQELYGLVFLTRYIDLFFRYVSL